MNDYKELIEILRDDYKAWGDGRTQNFFEVTLRCKYAADAIEQLVSDYEILAKMYAKVNEDLCARTKERDAAVEDLSLIVHDMGNTCICDYCIGCEKDGHYAPCDTDDGDKWEWRGVPK